MRQPSLDGSRISKFIAAIALLALLVTGTFYVLQHVWTHSTKNEPAAKSVRASAPSPAIHENTPTQASRLAAIKPAPQVSRKPAPEKIRTATLDAALQQIPVSPKSNDLPRLEAKKKAFGKDELRMQPDTGSTEVGGETGEDPKLRADYFYRQRAYPFDQTPAGALQQSRQQLDAMITQQRAMGILPEENAAVPNAVGFPGPANWTNLGPQPVTNSAGGANFGNPAATGRVTAIAVDPTTTNPASQVVYLGAATGGVWKSTDGGSSWNTIFDQNNSLAIGGIAIAPSSNTTLYVGTGESNFSGDSYYGAGVYKSTDGGGTWTQQCGGASVSFCGPTFSGGFQVSSIAGGFFVGSIAVHPTNANIALAAVDDIGNTNLSGIYRTTDGGANWNLIASASGAAGNSIVWNPSDSTVVYATLGEIGNSAKFGVYKSTDSGVTFSRLTGNGAIGNLLPTTNLGRHVLAVAPSNGSVVYVSINAESSSGLLGLAKSTDAGVTWTFTTPGTLPNLPNFCSGQCWYDMAMAVLPNDPNTLIVGGSAFTNNSSTDFRTTDGGTTWTDITVGSSAVRPHVDTHAMTFAATTGGFRLYTGNDGGIWFTDNPSASTVTWQPGNNANLTITQFYPGHAVHPSDENISFGGTQDNGTEKYSGNLAWDHVTCGDGAWAAIDPVITTTVYANCQFISILKSTLDGVAGSWSVITNEIPTSGERSLFIPPLVQDQNQSGRLYVGTFRVWQSQTYGNDWAPISPDLTSGSSSEVTSVSVARGHSDVVYATTTDGRVWRTTNAGAGSGAAWTNLTKSPLPGRYATMVRTDQSNSDIAYVSYSGFNGFVIGGSLDTAGHIFKTTDGGNTWTDISGSGAGALPNTPVNDIAVVHLGSPLNFDAVFIATDVGVFECPDPTSATPCQTWSPVGTGLPKVPVVGLAYRENSATIRAITHGRGVWVMETPGISATGLLLLTSITPSSRASGSGLFTMTFDGNDFGVPSGTPQILIDGVDPGVSNITLTNSNHMTATIPASVTANPGSHQVTIMQLGHAATPQNPTCCISFSVTGPAPTLTVINPTQANVGAASFPLTLTGTNFVCGATPSASLVQFGTTQLNPSTCTSTSMTATIPSSLLTIPGSVNVKAFNPGPGGGNSSAISFTVGSPATNDNFANAIAISSLPFTDTESTGAATTEAGEPIPGSICTLTGTPSAATHSIWYSYTPASNGVVTFSSPGETESGIIQVVTGSALGALVGVPGGCGFDATSFGFATRQAPTVKVLAGVTYHIMLSDFRGTGGTGVLSAAIAAPPANDDFANAITVNTVGFADTRTTTGATTELGESLPACTSEQAAGTHSVWYKYTPGSSGTAVFNTNGSSIDSVIQVVTGGLGGFSAATGGCADANGSGVGETVSATVTSGVTYFIMVSDFNGVGGTSVLNFTSGPAPTVGGTPDMTITKSHTGNFTQGQIGANYTITATNSGTAATTGTVTVVDTLPPGMTGTAISGTGWSCVLSTLTCTRSDALSASTSYPVITLTVNVSTTAGASLGNFAAVSGGGETNLANDLAVDTTTITPAPDLTLSKTHTGNFFQGQVGATYILTVTNSGTAATVGTVTLVDTLPTGLTATALTGTGWTCTLGTLTCSRGDALTAATSYPAVTLTVTVGGTAPATVTNTANVSGGGENNPGNDAASDLTTVTTGAPDMTVVGSHTGNFTEGQTGASYSIVVTNSGTGASNGIVTVVDTLPAAFNGTVTAMAGTGWTCNVGTRTCTRSDVLAAAASYPAVTLTFNVPNNAPASVSNSVAVSGGGEVNTANDTSTDPTTVVLVPDMTVTVTNPNPIQQGNPAATYTITVTNSGGTATTAAVSVVGSASVGQTFVSIAGTGWTCTNATQTCTRSDVLAAGASYPVVTMTVSVSNTVIGNIAGLATVSGGGETNTSNDTAIDPLTVTTSPDMVVTSSHAGSFAQGQTGATYSLSVQDGGLGSTSGTVTVVDTLPASLTATAMNGTGWSCIVATLTCTRNDVLGGTLFYPPIALTVNVSASAPASITNSVAVSGGGEFNTANDTGTDPTTITVSSLADMTITKTHAGNFVQNQPGTYLVTASNTGAGPTSGLVTVADTLPTGMTASSIAGTGWTCVLGTLTCTRSDALASGSSYPAITLTVFVAGNAPASLTNNVTVSGGGEVNSTNDSASDVTTILAAADLAITKTHVGNFTAGQIGGIYTITVTNSSTGGATLGTVNVTEAGGPGLTITAISGTGWICTLGITGCTRSDSLAAGASYPPITVTVNVSTNPFPTTTNNAGVSGGSEVNTSNDTANDLTTITPVADLTISKSHSGTFTQGQTGATYSIFVVNVNVLAATSGTITVVDTLPTGLTATAISGTGWTCTLATLTCTRADVIAPNTALPTITVTVNVANNAPSIVTNTATVSGGGEVITTNDTATDPTAVIQVADMTITKSHTGNFVQGQVGANYTITATNSGAGPTSGTVTVVDALPTGLTATAMAGTGWTCTLGTLTCTRSDVLAAAGSYPAITLTVTVANNAAASVTNTATVSGGGELNTANDTANDITTVTLASDLTITKSHTGNFTQGQVGATYSITVSNAGPGPTTGTVTVVDTLPTGLTATAMAGTGWTCTVATATCTRSDALAVSASYPAITLTVTVANNAAASITNTAVVSGGGELITANDTAIDPTTVILVADMTITKSHVGNFTQGQVGAAYAITVSNGGGGPTIGTVTVVDTLPAALTATAITGAGWTCTLGTLTCTRADVLAAASSYPAIALTVTVANNAAASVTNTATVSGGGELNVANDSASDITAITQLADMTITKSHTGSFVQGQVGATYTITAANSGTGPTSGTVTVVDVLPASLTATAMTGTGWTCNVGTVSCTRADALAAAGSYPPITLTVTVAASAPASVTNSVTVSGGGEIIVANDTANDVTAVLTPATASLSVNTLSFTNQGVNTTSSAKSITVTNTGGATLTFTAAPAITATNAANFAVAAGTTCTNGANVVGGGNCIVNITFTPPSTASFGPATLTLTDNASPTTQTATLTGTGIDFTESGPTSPVTVTAGQTATYTITLTPGTGGFPNAVTFSASGLPAATTATFNPTSVTPGATSATTVLSIATTARGALPPSNNPKPWTPPQFVLWSFALAATLLGFIAFGRTARRRRLTTAMFAAVALLLAIGIGGCSSMTGTPAGTSTITVTATSGALVHTTTVTLTVQ